MIEGLLVPYTISLYYLVGKNRKIVFDRNTRDCRQRLSRQDSARWDCAVN